MAENSIMKTITLKADDKYLEQVLIFVKSPVQDMLSIENENKIDLAVEEIFVNIAHYAYPPKEGEVTINCGLKENPKRLFIEFVDSGIQFNPLARPDPDITASAEERDIGGLGIFLTKKFMDKVEYQNKDGKNILLIEKII